MIRVDDPPTPTAERRAILSKFCELTEYGPSDILSFSSMTGLFMTRNGGMYQVEGDQIKHIKGPSPDPSERI